MGRRPSESAKMRKNSDGTQMWWLRGELHRNNGPAVIWPDGTTQWYRHGKLHRTSGPAVIRMTRGAFRSQEWWVDGVRYYSDFEYQIALKGSGYGLSQVAKRSLRRHLAKAAQDQT